MPALMGFGGSNAQSVDAATSRAQLVKKPLAPGPTDPNAIGTTPPPAPDAVLAASQAALSAQQAGARASKRAFSSGDAPATGKPGASTPGLLGKAPVLGGLFGALTSRRKF